MKRTLKFVFVGVAGVLANAFLASASVNGFVRGLAAGFSEQSDLSALYGEVVLKTEIGNQQTFMKGDVRFREGLFFGERKTVIELKEAYVGYQGSIIDCYLGNQIVTWGRTDGFNPTGNLHPTDFFFLSDDPDDQKLGNFMLRTNIRPFNEGELALVYIPCFKPSIYRYELFDLGEGISFADAQLPATTLQNGTLAARFNVEWPAIGFSVSYFNGYDPFYGFNMQSFTITTAPVIVYQPAFYRKQTFGADFALPLGSVILRGEGAYNLTTNYETAMQIPNPDISGVAGIEVNMIGIKAIVQYIGKYTFDFTSQVLPVLSDPLDPVEVFVYANAMATYEAELFNRKMVHQQKAQNHAVFLSLSRSFAYDLFSLRVSGYYDITSEEYMVRPELRWKLTDALSLSVSGNWMDGPEKSVFSYTGKVLGGVTMGLTVYF